MPRAQGVSQTPHALLNLTETFQVWVRLLRMDLSKVLLHLFLNKILLCLLFQVGCRAARWEMSSLLCRFSLLVCSVKGRAGGLANRQHLSSAKGRVMPTAASNLRNSLQEKWPRQIVLLGFESVGMVF